MKLAVVDLKWFCQDEKQYAKAKSPSAKTHQPNFNQLPSDLSPENMVPEVGLEPTRYL
jgi:hypothetical protein